MDKQNHYTSLTKQLGIDIIKLTSELPNNIPSKIIARQIVRCSTSVGANYRAVCRARSKADFISKLGIVEEEADETIYWLEVINDIGLVKKERLMNLFSLAGRIVAFTISSQKTAKRNPGIRKKGNSKFTSVSQLAISNKQLAKENRRF